MSSSLAQAQPEPGPRLLSLAGLWLVPGVLMSLQMYLTPLIDRSPLPPPVALVPALLEWLVWVPLTPLVFRLGRRFPLSWPPAVRTVLTHLGASCSASAFRGVVYAGTTVLWVRTIPDEQLAGYFGRVMIGWIPIAAVTYCAILGAGAALDFRERSRRGETRAAELETRLARAELEALKAHLHPHFLFNALHTVGALVRTGRRNTAVRTIADLSTLLRELLRTDAPEQVPLAAELDFARRYLGLVELRFHDRIQIAWQVEAETERALVPRMTLQPLVENAIRHGISPWSDAGRLTISAERNGAELWLEVIDDGRGPESSRPRRATPGTGLAAVRARLHRLHGEKGSLMLERAEPRGAVARVRLPYLAPTSASAPVASA